jgi:hypothetical protein
MISGRRRSWRGGGGGGGGRRREDDEDGSGAGGLPWVRRQRPPLAVGPAKALIDDTSTFDDLSLSLSAFCSVHRRQQFLQSCTTVRSMTILYLYTRCRHIHTNTRGTCALCVSSHCHVYHGRPRSTQQQASACLLSYLFSTAISFFSSYIKIQSCTDNNSTMTDVKHQLYRLCMLNSVRPPSPWPFFSCPGLGSWEGL